MEEEAELESVLLATQLELKNVTEDLEHVEKQLNKLLQRQEKLREQKLKLKKKIGSLEHQMSNVGLQWDSDEHPWSSELLRLSREYFQIDEFRPLQKETMNVTLSNLDCILIMPTGGGKSLCFQLPALLCNGFTLVVSPLVSLMEDQLMALKERHIKATMLSASIPPKTVTEIQNQLVEKNCPFKIIYVTPEKLAKSKRFMAKLEKAYSISNISRIVIDEVHCASHWGHDFRPDYKILGILKRQFPKVPLLGLTATASEKVLDDVKDMLNLEGSCQVFRASFNRPNLYYEVHQTSLDNKELVKEIATRIKTQFRNMSGIVYCFSRKDSEEIAQSLCQYGVKARCYHSDVRPDLKSSVHQSWTKGDLQVVVATVAFGMGIDKPNVRFVIHYSISKSMENYYQESGRAGRDDSKSWCILYFRFQDISRQSAMVFTVFELLFPWTEKTGLQNLYNMLRYCIDKKNCRRTIIGRYFAEHWSASKCKEMCDNCCLKGETADRDLKSDAEVLISILDNAKAKEERLTPFKLVELWQGKGKASLRPSTPSSLSRGNCEGVVTKLLVEQVLTEDFHFTPYSTITYVIKGPRWSLLKNDQITVKLDVQFIQEKGREKRGHEGDSEDDIEDDIVENATTKKKRKQEIIQIESSDDSDK